MNVFRFRGRAGRLFCSFLFVICICSQTVFAQASAPINAETQAPEKVQTAESSSADVSNKVIADTVKVQTNEPETAIVPSSNNDAEAVLTDPNAKKDTVKSDKAKKVDFGAVLKDLDGDGINDAEIQTDLLKVVISNKTGNISLYYLKGDKFNEQILPAPVFKMPGIEKSDDKEEAAKLLEYENGRKKYVEKYNSFVTEVSGASFNNGYTFEIENNTEPGVIAVKANANIIRDDQSGSLLLTKRYVFKKDSYAFNISHIFTNGASKLITVGSDTENGLSLSFGPGLFLKPYTRSMFLGLESKGKINVYTSPKDFQKAAIDNITFDGAGIKDQYFCVLIDSISEKVNVLAKEYEVGISGVSAKFFTCGLKKFNIGAGETRTFDFSVYAGPMITHYLNKANREEVLEHGFLSSILMKTLHFFYTLVPNYGIAIILLTLLVRIILYPLTLKQTESMAAMQRLAPKMQDLKDRYKDDQAKLQEEMLKLYQKNNVNPASGCLPMLLQMPILFALYRTIQSAVELRKSSFLWMDDLSRSDPYIILPIAIAVLMYMQSNAQSGKNKNIDPTQKQMMVMMPMMMFAITWSLPAGLLVYWFASSVLGILQQMQANSMMSAANKEEKY